jgi:hypothetical protein
VILGLPKGAGRKLFPLKSRLASLTPSVLTTCLLLPGFRVKSTRKEALLSGLEQTRSPSNHRHSAAYADANFRRTFPLPAGPPPRLHHRRSVLCLSFLEFTFAPCMYVEFLLNECTFFCVFEFKLSDQVAQGGCAPRVQHQHPPTSRNPTRQFSHETIFLLKIPSS